MNETKATRYQRLKRRTQAMALVSGGALLAIVSLTPVAPSLAAWASSQGGDTVLGDFIAILIFIFCVVALWELVALPAALYLEVGPGRRFQRGSTSLSSVLTAHAQTSAIAITAGVVAAIVVLVSAWMAGGGWWLAAATVFAVIRALALHAAPALVQATGRTRPLSKPGLRTALETLAAEARVRVAGIDEWVGDPASPATAFVGGVGATRRVFVSAELVRDWPDEEITVVVAHELAHLRHHDLWRRAALDAVLSLAALWIASLALQSAGPALGIGLQPSLAALPFIALVAGAVWVASAPVRHAQSRQHERRADAFALAVTGGAAAFQAAIRRLGARHLAEERPSKLTRWLYYQHPSVAERLALAATPAGVLPRR